MMPRARRVAGRRSRISVQHRFNSPFKAVRSRHGRCGCDRVSVVHAGEADEGEQVGGVLGRRCAHAEHEVVAGQLAFEAQAAGREPRQRVEPVNCPQQLGEHQGEPVSSLHVGELMTEDGVEADVGPAVGAGRQQDDRVDRAPRHGKSDARRLQQPDWTRDAECAFDKSRCRCDPGRRHRHRSCGEPFEAQQAGNQHEHEDGRSGQLKPSEPPPELGCEARRGGLFPGDIQDGNGCIRDLRLRVLRDRADVADLGPWHGWRWQLPAPRRRERLQQGDGCGARNRDGQRPVSGRSGAAPHQPQRREADGEHDERLHRRASLRAFSIIAAMRSSSSSETRVPSPPSTAATTFSADPS